MATGPTKEIGDMTDEEFTAFKAELSPEKPDTSTEPPESTDGEKPPEEGASAPGAEPEPSQGGQPVTPPPADPVQEKLTALEKKYQEQNERLLSQIENLHKLNGHLSNELGVLRNKTAEKPLAKPTAAEILENPDIGTEKMVHAVLAEEKRRQAANTEQTRMVMEKTMELAKANVPNFDALVPDMAEVLKGRGVDGEILRIFQQYPAAVIRSPEHLVELATVAAERKEKAQLQKTIEELKKQTEELRKGPEKVVKNLASAANSGPTITSANVRTRSEGKVPSTADISKMSDAELQAFKKRLGLK